MSAKRLHLITTAFELFYQKGIHAVGINEILSESGVAKKTLYHHFAGKDELVLAVLEYRDQRFCQWLKGNLDKATSGMDKIDALFDALDDWFNDRVDALSPFHGCFFINVSGEYSAPDHPIHQQCTQHKRNVAMLLRGQFEVLGIDASLGSRLTDDLCLLKEGAITLAYVQGDRKAALKAKDTAKRLVAADL